MLFLDDGYFKDDPEYLNKREVVKLQHQMFQVRKLYDMNEAGGKSAARLDEIQAAAR